MKILKALNKRIITLLARKAILFNAAAISFNVLICILPIALLIVSALGFLLNNTDTYGQIEGYLRDFLPAFLFQLLEQDGGQENLLHQLLDPIIVNRNVNGVIGLVSLSFFSQGLFSSIGHTLHDIFSVRDEKPAWRVILRNYLTFGLIGSVLVGSSFLLQTVTLFDGLSLSLPWIEAELNISTLWQWVNLITSQFLTTLLVYILFRTASGMPISKRTALAGGLFFTFFLETAKALLSWYFSYAFETYQSLYQSYTLVIMVTLWLYYIGIMFNISAIGARALRDVFGWAPTLKDKKLSESMKS